MAKSSAAPATNFEKLKELAEKATPGPWTVRVADSADEPEDIRLYKLETPLKSEKEFVGNTIPQIMNELIANARWMSAANPKAILEILTAHQALYEALSAAKKSLEESFSPEAARQAYAAGLGASEWESFMPETYYTITAALALADAAQGEK